MSIIKPLDRQDYRVLFNLSKRIEPYAKHNYYDEFCDNMDKRRGFTIWDSGGTLVSLLSYSDFVPGSMVMIHFLQDGFLTVDVVKKAFSFPFLELHVPRLVSYCIPEFNDPARIFLNRLGFRYEGTFKEAIRLPDGPKDIEIYGMLKRECAWI
jgi:RimJ/RimL family protein N-acetyltransferase